MEVGREHWLRLDADISSKFCQDGGDLFALVNGGSGPGLGEFMRRVTGRAVPHSEQQRSALASHAQPSTSPETHTRWERLCRRLVLATLRVQQSPSINWSGDWQDFDLSLERIGMPEWVSPDATGCSYNQMCAAVEALAHFHNHFAQTSKLDAHPWIPVTPLQLSCVPSVQAHYVSTFQSLRDYLSGAFSSETFTACERLCTCYPELLNRMAQPPLTLLHGQFQPACVRFSVRSGKPAVAAVDWRFVCRGRGAYDFALFLALGVSAEERREHERELVELYLQATGKASAFGFVPQPVRIAFEDEVRAALLLGLAHHLMRDAGSLSLAEPGRSSDAARLRMERLGVAVDDWDSILLVGGFESTRKPKRLGGARAKKKPRRPKPRARGRSSSKGRSASKDRRPSLSPPRVARGKGASNSKSPSATRRKAAHV